MNTPPSEPVRWLATCPEDIKEVVEQELEALGASVFGQADGVHGAALGEGAVPAGGRTSVGVDDAVGSAGAVRAAPGPDAGSDRGGVEDARGTLLFRRSKPGTRDVSLLVEQIARASARWRSRPEG